MKKVSGGWRETGCANPSKSLFQRQRLLGLTLVLLLNGTVPSGLWASKKIPKGKLKLWPCGSVSKVKDSTTHNNGWVVELEGVSYSITPFKAFTEFVTLTKDKHAHLLVPFFWVKRNKEEGSGNMEVNMMSYNGLKVPTLVNTDQIDTSVQLFLEDKVDEVKPSASKKRKTK